MLNEHCSSTNYQPLHQVINGLWMKVGVIKPALSHPLKMVEYYPCVQPLQPALSPISIDVQPRKFWLMIDVWPAGTTNPCAWPFCPVFFQLTRKTCVKVAVLSECEPKADYKSTVLKLHGPFWALFMEQLYDSDYLGYSRMRLGVIAKVGRNP